MVLTTLEGTQAAEEARSAAPFPSPRWSDSWNAIANSISLN